jgi:cyclin-dependent kinase-like
MLIFLLGNLIPRHQELFYKNPVFAGVRLPEVKDAEAEPLESRYPKLPEAVISLAKVIVPFPAVW